MISNAELRQIADLAKLSISDEMLQASTADLNNILKLAEQLSAVDTTDITPMAHPLHMSQRLRADHVSEQDGRELFQSIAPKTGKKHYLVPTIIE